MHNQQKLISVVLLGMSLLLSGNAWPAQAGRVQFVNGEVQVTDAAGMAHAVQKGDAINEGDTLTSAKAASAQIKMQDGGFVAVRPDTQLKFDSFKFSGKEGEPENSFFSLFKGGFRAVTGLIGRVRKQDYHITTPAATIGIRGTDHETVMVLPDNPLVLAGGAAPGAYNKVNLGETYMTTDKGTIFVLPNQMGFAGGLNQMPQIQPINANLFTVAPQPSPGANMDSGKGENKGARDTAVVDTVAEAKGGATPVNNAIQNNNANVLQAVAPPAVVVTPPVVAANNLFDGVNPTATNLNFMNAEYNPTSGGHNAGGAQGGGMIATFDAQGVSTLLLCVNCTGYLRMNATTFEGGSDQGVIAWGRWAAGTPTLWGWGPQTLTADQGFHQVVGVPVTMPPQLDGVAYVFIGGTRPTEATNTVTGNVWSVSGGSLTANFLSNKLSANLNLGMRNAQGSSTYVMNVSGAASPTGFNFVAGPVTGNGASNACTTACAANGTVMFAGAAATHAGMAYEFSQTSGAFVGTFVQGIAAFRR